MSKPFSMGGFQAARDTAAAEWIIAALRDFALAVDCLVPAGFQAYVRVFHPAHRVDRESPDPWRNRTLVSWAQIAAANGTTAHAGMQLPALTGSFAFMQHGQPGVYDHPPLEGSLPEEIVPDLVTVLARHTRTPDNCWFAVWNGFGDTRDDIQRAPVFSVPKRDYFLLRGSIDAAGEQVLNSPWQTANIWWPDDRAWCVATEIDLNTTYVGCALDCCKDILGSPLEALQIDPSTGIAWNSDEINPEPRRDLGPT